MPSPLDLLNALLEAEADVLSAEERKKNLRVELEEVLRAELDKGGAIPTFKVRGVAQATLAGVDKLSPTVIDGVAYTRWARRNHQGSVTMVVEIPYQSVDAALGAALTTLLAGIPSVVTRYEVIPSLWKWVQENSAGLPDGSVVTADGERVEGAEMVPSPIRMQVRFDPEAKARALASRTVTVPAEVEDSPQEPLIAVATRQEATQTASVDSDSQRGGQAGA